MHFFIYFFYKLQKRYEDQSKKPGIYQNLFAAGLLLAIFFIALLLIDTTRHQAKFYNYIPIFLSISALIAIILIYTDNKWLKSLRSWRIFIICFFSIISILSLLYVPTLWGHDAAKSILGGEPTINLTLLDNSSHLSNQPFVLRMHQNGMYVVGVEDLRALVYI